jgi:hypothetical protein
MRMKLPRHWVSRGPTHFLRVDGTIVEIALREANGGTSRDETIERQVGWLVKLPISLHENPNGGASYVEEFLPGNRFFTLGEVLRKVDQEWGPPPHVQARIPAEWLGGDLERLAREAPDQEIK